jgi:hypothetical protein
MGNPVSWLESAYQSAERDLASLEEAQSLGNSKQMEQVAENYGEAVNNGGGIFSLLGLPHWSTAQLRGYAIRAVKIVVGIALIILGVAHLRAPASNSVPKVVPIPV